MRALHFDGQSLRLVEKPYPARDGEALIRVRLAGICSTDREITRGYMGFVGTPGHEFVGTVEAAPGAPEWEGRRVAGEINAACRTCATCRAGLPNHCPSRTVLGILVRDGSHAEFLALPAANLHAVPDSIPDEQAVFIEPLAAAFEPFRQGLQVEPGEPAYVLGDGKLGLLQARTLALAGARVTVVGKHPRKLALAERWGLGTATPDAPPPGGVGLVAECTGAPSGLGLALRLLCPRGTLVLKSTYAGAPRLALAPVVINELTVLGSRCGNFEDALGALAAGRVAVADLIDAEFPLSDGVAAYERAQAPGVLKVLLRP